MASAASAPVPASGGSGALAPSEVPVPPATSGTAGGRHTMPRTSRRGSSADPGVSGAAPSASPRRRLRWRVLLHPLTVICAVQAACSLSLVWSNTAFTDEADYLRLGHLILASWLHGKSWPATFGEKILSGSPFIYPPIGAMADSLGGLAAARILSLAFLVAATVLLYSAARRLLGPTEAAIAAALWALSEPVIRLAFATYDPMSVFLVALAAWLAVQAGYRSRPVALGAACAAALALSTATAYSGLVIDPIVVAFAFLVWLPRHGIRRACYSTAWLAGAWLVFFTLLITVSRSWSGIVFTVLNRQVDDFQSARVILIDVLAYSGLIIVAALAAAVIAVRAENGQRRALLVLLSGTALLVPAAQFYVRTGWALDKHLAYGIWFAAIAAGYGCRMTVRWLSASLRDRRGVVALVGVAALLVAGAADRQLASVTFRAWQNSSAFIAAFRPVAARSDGLIFASAQKRVAEYYTPEGNEWWRWKITDLPLDPAGVPRADWYSYYLARLRSGQYGVIALFYDRPASLTLPGSGPSPISRASLISAQLLGLAPLKSSEPGVTVLTRVLAHDREYRLMAVGPYDSLPEAGVFAIWQRRPAG
jgi:Dolichyl-phosphate-mannose-protein mannosyltransferase